MNIEKLKKEILYTIVRVKTAKAGGSGTVVHSKPGSTYVLTCHHVIEDAITVKTEWMPPPIGRDIKKEFRKSVVVEFFDYENVPFGHRPLTYSADGDIMAYDKTHDMALIKLRTLKQYPHVAKLISAEEEKKITIGSEVCAVGCALLHDPIVTFGEVTHMGDEIDYKDYWMSNASIIFGNSGGAVFLINENEKPCYFIGIPSRLDVVGWGSPVTHCGYFSPMHRVVEFLKEKVFDFIINDKLTEEICAQKRKKIESIEKRKLSMMPMKESEEEPEK